MGLTKAEKRTRIKLRIRKTISGTPESPRLSVFRSNKEIYAQLIDDIGGKTLAAASSLGDKSAHSGNKVEQATIVGKKIAEAAKTAGIEKVVFDRNGYQYHGRVKSLAEAARENGLKF
jgi:large subunit ribosomal protein L18